MSHLQTTRFNRDDSLKFAEDFADAICVDDQDLVIANFNSTWDQFEKEVLYGMLLPVQKLIPDLPGFFENKKTFHESFPRCSNKLWEDRLRRVVRTHSRLSQNDIAEVLSSDPHLGNVYSDLLWALDTFNMHIAAHLMEKLDFKTLGSDKKKMLEDAREQIVNIVSKLQQITRRPVFPLSIHFESERATGKRKSQIQKMEVLLDRKEIQKEELLEARDSLSWALDRIVFYIAVDKDHLADIAFGELVTCLKREEEIARTRNLIKGLQPLYYIAECIDNKMIKNIETSLKYRLLKIIDDVDQFLKDDENRDSGGHIKRRITSIRKKLE